MYFENTLNKTPGRFFSFLGRQVSLFFVLLVFFLVSGCRSVSSRDFSGPQRCGADTAVRWAGTYTGILPCPDCDGIETSVTLGADSTYRIQTLHSGTKRVRMRTGTFFLTRDGKQVVIGDAKDIPERYLLGKNAIVRLDLNGSVADPGAWRYLLKKADASGDIALTGTNWRLVGINGTALAAGSARVPYVLLKPTVLAAATGFHAVIV